MNVVASTQQMRVDHFRKHRKKFCGRLAVVCCCEILPYGFEIPQCGIDRVVFRCSARIREIVGQHSLVHVERKCEKHGSCNVEMAGCDEEAWQRNHRVAAPVAK